jgi:flagellar hook assembly protein FlgD
VWPNPVETAARIGFTLPGALAPARATIEVFDAQGRLRSTIHDAPLGSGAHALDWTAVDGAGRPLPSGVYAMRLTVGSWTTTQRVTVVH